MSLAERRFIYPTSGRSERLLRKIIAGAELLAFLNRSRRIRIIYILERNQQDTEYCCSTRISGWAGQGYQFAKWLKRNEPQKSSIADLAVLLNKLTPLRAGRSV